VDERTVRQANEVAQAMGKCANVHVAIDTGMGRMFGNTSLSEES
jgi:hypothetical protein